MVITTGMWAPLVYFLVCVEMVALWILKWLNCSLLHIECLVWFLPMVSPWWCVQCESLHTSFSFHLLPWDLLFTILHPPWSYNIHMHSLIYIPIAFYHQLCQTAIILPTSQPTNQPACGQPPHCIVNWYISIGVTQSSSLNHWTSSRTACNWVVRGSLLLQGW